MQLSQAISRTEEEKLTLRYLFITFFKIGCVAFGGHLALVSLVERLMVEQDQTLEHEVILDGVTIATLLPGPLAVNVVTYIGYHLKGKSGALVSIVGILLPACMLMVIIAFLYFNYTYKVQWLHAMQYVGAVVSVLILSTGLQLFKKQLLGDYKRTALCALVVVLACLTSSYFITIGIIAYGAVMGLQFEKEKWNISTMFNKAVIKQRRIVRPRIAVLALILAANELFFVTGSFKHFDNVFLKICSVFSGISLSLFGGGYVMIPIMQSLFVGNLHWLSSKEFVDTIAFSQLTPGPILVSSTFIGFKLAGCSGALLATVAMFAPSAILMILVAKAFRKNKDQKVLQAMLSGVKAVVVGLILSSALKLIFDQPRSFVLAVLGVACLILNLKYKVSPVYLILASIAVGVIKNLLYVQFQ
jgi:chromate transporter